MDLEQKREILARILTKEIKVRKVRVNGLVRVKDDVITPYLAPLLAQDNLAKLLNQIGTAKEGLTELGAFEMVDVHVNNAGRCGEVVAVDLNVSVSEASRGKYGMNVDSDARGNDGTFSVQAAQRNLFGRLESLKLSYSKGTRIADDLTLQLHKPLLGRKGKSADLLWELGKQSAANRTGGFTTSDLSSSLLYKRRLLGGVGSLEVSTLWQQILAGGGGGVSVKVREEFGHHVKCAARCTYERDARDEAIVPTKGHYLRLSGEVAGFLGDVHHVKVDGQVQKVRSLPLFGYTAALSLRAGILHSPSPRTWITDRFFVGGPGSVRGFFEDGVGRSAGGVGGTCHWGAGLSLYRGLPFSPHIWGLGPHIRLHHFVNAGNLSSDPSSLLRDGATRMSVGSGLILRVGGIMRMEINYAVPVRFQPGDAINHGLQFGIGVYFM